MTLDFSVVKRGAALEWWAWGIYVRIRNQSRGKKVVNSWHYSTPLFN